jgi:hypothetical protein
MRTTIGDLDEAHLLTTYRELKRERMRLLRQVAALEDRMTDVESRIRAGVTERIWREHPRWRRDRPTTHRRVEGLASHAVGDLVSFARPLLGGSKFVNALAEDPQNSSSGGQHRRR